MELLHIYWQMLGEIHHIEFDRIKSIHTDVFIRQSEDLNFSQ